MASPPEFELELEDSDLLKMLEEPLSPLTLLSISAIITTISLFFCGIPICMQIYRRRSTNEISGFPFLMGFLGGAFWLRYGLLKSDLTMVTVNVVGVSLMFLYLLFYLYHSRPRTSFLIQLLIVLKIVVVMLVLVHFYGLDSLKMLGFVCMTFNIVNFGAPLAGLTTVLRNRCCSTLPLPLCTANLLVSSQWCLYGVCVKDIFIIIPNGAGVLLASVQICLFLVLPRREGTHAPLSKCCPCVMDLEKGYEGGLIANVEEEGGRSGRRKRRAEKRGGGGAGTGHTAQDDANQNWLRVRNNKFLNRQRVIDRRMIPTTRTGCIEFLRAGGGFDASFGSVSSRATADSWMSNSAISRISSSLSHPELFAAVQQATDFDQSIGEAPAEMEDSTEIQSHHLPSASSSGFQSQGLARGTSQSRPANDEQLVPVDENSEPMAADRNGATSGTNGGGTTDLLFVRTLSVPDLMAKQPQTDGENRS